MLFAVLLAALAMPATACSDDGSDKVATPPPTARAPVAAPTGVPGVERAATLRGTLTLDGAPLEAQFLGVRVLRAGLSAACQDKIPAVAGGGYEITVAADDEVRGCGAPGAGLLLWTFVGDTYYFTAETAPWPGDAEAAEFDATFSSAAPQGAGAPVTEFKGHLFGRDGNPLPGGTAIEAYVGEVLCGVTSLRHGDLAEGFYTLIVAGPESVAGCARDGTLTFRLDGEPAAETAVNDLGQGGAGHELDLTLR